MTSKSIYRSDAGKTEIMSVYDSVLSIWPVKYETKNLSTKHGDTFVIASGNKNAPSLILLHGASSNSTSWAGEVLEYSRYFRVYAIDILGEAGKSSQNRLRWDSLDYAEWLYDIFKELAIEKASIVGISQGAWTALRFATCYPEKVEKLVLLTPAGIVPTKASFILKAVFYSLFGKAGAKKINRIVVGTQELSPKVLNFMDLIQTNFKARVEKEYIFLDAELSNLDMPILLIGGTDDVIRSCQAIAERMKKVVTKLTVYLIPKMGHVLIGLNKQIIPYLLKDNQ